MELLIVIAIIGVLAAIALPAYSQYKDRAYDADAKTNLHNIYLACKVYWMDAGSGSDCTVAEASSTQYGYIQSTGITVVASGIENAFNGTGSHPSSNNTYTIDPQGTIS